MADKNNLTMDESFDFGIMDTSSFGNAKAVESFLSDTPLPNGEGIEEIDPEEEEAKQKAEAKKKNLEAARKALEEKRKAEAAKPKKTAEELLFGEEEDETKDEEKTEDEKTEDEKSKDDETPADESQIETFAKDLIRLGVLTQEDENEAVPKTGEELLEKLNKEKQAGAVQWIEGFLSRFGDDRRELFDAIFVNGVDPREYLPLYVRIEDMENVDITKENNQEMVFREFYRRLKFPTDKIEVKLQRAKDNGDLESESKDFLERLVAEDKEVAEGEKQKKIQKQAADKRADDEYKASIQKTLMEKVKAREMSGIPVSQELANKAFDFLNTKKYKAADGTLLTEFDKFVMDTKRPENIETRVLLALLKLTNFDFSKITKRAVSKQSNELFSAFAQKQAKKSAKGSGTPADWLEL